MDKRMATVISFEEQQIPNKDKRESELPLITWNGYARKGEETERMIRRIQKELEEIHEQLAMLDH